MIAAGSCAQKKCNAVCKADSPAQCAFSSKEGKFMPFSSSCELDNFACENPNRGKERVFG